MLFGHFNLTRNKMHTAATNITHELRTVWNNNPKFSWRFARVSSRGLQWENKPSKLKRSILSRCTARRRPKRGRVGTTGKKAKYKKKKILVLFSKIRCCLDWTCVKDVFAEGKFGKQIYSYSILYKSSSFYSTIYFTKYPLPLSTLRNRSAFSLSGYPPRFNGIGSVFFLCG